MDSRAHIARSALIEAHRRDPSRLAMSCPVLIESNETMELDGPMQTLDSATSPELSLGESTDPRVHILYKSSESLSPKLIGLGRASKNDLSIRQPSVSKIHAYLRETEAGKWEITDAGSRNGTWVDRSRLAEGESETLRDGMEIGLGRARFLFYTPEGLRDYLHARVVRERN
jgi:hypothetical protein